MVFLGYGELFFGLVDVVDAFAFEPVDTQLCIVLAVGQVACSERGEPEDRRAGQATG